MVKHKFFIKITIAITAPKIGIKCKNTPERFAPIKATPLIQKRMKQGQEIKLHKSKLEKMVFLI